MKRVARSLLGVPIGVAAGMFALFILNTINVGEVMWVAGLIDQALYDGAWINRAFAWALLYGLFIVPVMRGIKEGYREDYSYVGHLLLPLITCVLTVVAMFVVTFVIVFIITLLSALIDPDTILGTVAIIALFIAFCTPVTKVILVIFE